MLQFLIDELSGADQRCIDCNRSQRFSEDTGDFQENQGQIKLASC